MTEAETGHWGREKGPEDGKVVNLGTWPAPGSTPPPAPAPAPADSEPAKPRRRPVNRKFTDEQAAEVRARRAAGERSGKLAEELGVCRHTIQRLCAKRFYPAPQ